MAPIAPKDYETASVLDARLMPGCCSAVTPVPSNVALPVLNHPQRFPAATPCRRVPNCRLPVKVRNTRENGTRNRHGQRQAYPPVAGRTVTASEMLFACGGDAPRCTWQYAVSCVGEIDRTQLAQPRLPIRVVRLTARDSRFSRPWRLWPSGQCLTVSGQ